jgi:hypothetical protein
MGGIGAKLTVVHWPIAPRQPSEWTLIRRISRPPLCSLGCWAVQVEVFHELVVSSPSDRA